MRQAVRRRNPALGRIRRLWAYTPPMTLPKLALAAAMALLVVGSGIGADEPHRRRRAGRNGRDHSRRHRARGNRRHRHKRRAGVADDGHRRSRPFRFRRDPVRRVAPHIRSAGLRSPDDPAQRAADGRGAESRRQARPPRIAGSVRRPGRRRFQIAVGPAGSGSRACTTRAATIRRSPPIAKSRRGLRRCRWSTCRSAIPISRRSRTPRRKPHSRKC